MAGKSALPSKDGYGPAMLALSPKRRAFVEAMFFTDRGATGAAEIAGYSAGPPGSAALRVTAHRLAHDDRVKKAMLEVATARLRTEGLSEATRAILEIASDKTHKHRLGAATAILNRSGLHERAEHKTEVKVELSVSEMFAELLKLGKQPDEILINLPADEKKAVLELVKGKGYQEIGSNE